MQSAAAQTAPPPVSGEVITELDAPALGSAVAAPPIIFKIVPDEANLVIDGAPQDARVRAMARPSTGESRRVVVRAPGFADETLTIDDTAAASVDVWLTPKTAPPEAKAARERPSHATPVHAAPAAIAPLTPAAAPKKQTEPLPANPY
jgi:hypothetical protein